MQDKPILIAGKNGQLARCLHDLAMRQDVPVVAVGRPELDLESGDSVDRVMAAVEPSAIINAAAYTAVDRAEAEPASAFRINRDGAARLADAAGRRGIPFVHLSTDYVFDGSKRSSYREDDIPAPLNVYGASKLAGEIAVLEVSPCAAVIRTSWIYSPYGNNFVRTMQRLSETQPIVRVVGDQRGTPTSALDLAAAILHIVERLQSADGCDNAGIYNLAGEGQASWYDFAAAIFAGLARRGRSVPRLQAITSEQYPTPARRPQNSCLDSSKAERAFGVRLAPWRSSLEACLDQLAVEGRRAC
jgi:dTDP-4-dehydrorhamnose reductase